MYLSRGSPSSAIHSPAKTIHASGTYDPKLKCFPVWVKGQNVDPAWPRIEVW